jgi:hypothetical protein
MDTLKVSGAADNAISKLQNTQLNPMEEALFQAWAKANQIKKPDQPKDVVDYRGIYKMGGGQILPNGDLKRFAERVNDQHQLEQALRERIEARIANSKQKMLGDMDASVQNRERAATKAGLDSPEGSETK